MPRKSTEIAQLKLRIREDLRRRLEQAAKKRDVSLNREMTARLAESFERSDLLKLNTVATKLESAYARYAREGRDRSQTQELINAVEALIRKLPPGITEREANNIARVQEAIKAIWRIHGRTYDEYEETEHGSNE